MPKNEGNWFKKNGEKERRNRQTRQTNEKKNVKIKKKGQKKVE